MVVLSGLLGRVPPEVGMVVGHAGRAIWVEALGTFLVRWTWVAEDLWTQSGYGENVRLSHVGSCEWMFPHQMDRFGGDDVG